MRVQHLAEVALGSRLPGWGWLEVEGKGGKVGGERGGDQEGVLLGVREVLLGQAVFVMGAVNGKGRDAGAEPGDAVLAVRGVVDRRRTGRRSEESELVERDAIQEREEDLAERPVRKRVPELAPRTWRRPERHLAAGTPHRRRARSSWSLHRALSMESG